MADNGNSNKVLSEMQRLLAEKDDSFSPEAINRMVLALLMELDVRMTRVESTLGSITPAVKVILWIGSAIGISFIGLIWSVIIGKAEINFLP